MLLHKYLTSFGKYLILMGRSISRPERMRMFMKQYIKEMDREYPGFLTRSFGALVRGDISGLGHHASR